MPGTVLASCEQGAAAAEEEEREDAADAAEELAPSLLFLSFDLELPIL